VHPNHSNSRVTRVECLHGNATSQSIRNKTKINALVRLLNGSYKESYNFSLAAAPSGDVNLLFFSEKKRMVNQVAIGIRMLILYRRREILHLKPEKEKRIRELLKIACR